MKEERRVLEEQRDKGEDGSRSQWISPCTRAPSPAPSPKMQFLVCELNMGSMKLEGSCPKQQPQAALLPCKG